ncbi:MAG TPA: HlyD family secretion protein [Syntrophales bacterium]|nr:HlyD family secretion protein [Syntrophales bacterium]HOM06248.1 HlyD family secretion protein [Syntrophales bacterium]HON99312.1 HlyD family secretion protein [Syntrophales bacterium]HPC00137.1 HlyD family secretion protein [Syntrophales bacterium]HPQ05770.1 HlyD family secretion protein [Syntrophales bacterium]
MIEFFRAKERGRRVVAIVLVVVGAAALVWSGRWLYWRLNHVTTDAAYVKADMANIAPEVPGRVLKIEVREGETVREGQVLFRIDPEQLERQVNVARADLASLEATRERQKADLDQARQTVPAAVEAARAAREVALRQEAKALANLEQWRRQNERFQNLYEKKTIGKARLDEVETAFRAAEADHAAARAQVALAEARLREAEASRAVIAKAAAALRQVEDGVTKAREAYGIASLNRARCEVKAPFAGVVARVLVREGDYAVPGRPVVYLYNPETRYVEARFEETKIRYITPGKKADIKVDNLPNRPLTGTVVDLTPAAAAEFALIPRDISAGEFTKVVQRVPVRIAVDDLKNRPDLLPGLSCEVSIRR